MSIGKVFERLSILLSFTTFTDSLVGQQIVKAAACQSPPYPPYSPAYT